MTSKLFFISTWLFVLFFLFASVLSVDCIWPEQKCVGNDKYQCNDLGSWEYFSTCPSGTICIMQTSTSIYAVCEATTSENITTTTTTIIELTTTPMELTTTPGETTTSTISATTIPQLIGEYTRIDTSNNRIIIGEALNNARDMITKTDLPNLLADGKVTDSLGTSYPYSQNIQLNGNAHVYYSRSDDDLLDPKLHIEMEPVSGKPTYTTGVTFSKSLPVSSPNVTMKLYSTINLFGKGYAIGKSDYNTLVLYDESNTYLLREGESTTQYFGDNSYTIKVEGVSSAYSGVVSVNGISNSVTQGNVYNIAGLDVYVSSVYYYPKEGGVSSMKLIIGYSKITLENGDEVLFGTSDYVENTLVTINGDSNTNTISSFTISTPAQDSNHDDIEIGESYTDPVWKTFNLKFLSTTPSLNSLTKDSIVIPSSSDSASIRFTDYSGYEKTINFAYDNDTTAGTVTLYLMDSNSYEIHVKEGDRIYYKDYVVVNKGDNTQLLQLSNVPAGQIRTTDVLRFTDVFTGTTYEHTFTSSEIKANSCSGGAGANVAMRIGSQDYYVMVCNASAKASSYAMITWDDRIFYKGYITVNKGGDTHFLQLTNVPSGQIRITDVLRFTDQSTGAVYEHTFTSDEIGANSCSSGVGANVIMRIGLQDYYVMVCNASTKINSYVVITWKDPNVYPGDTGADYGIPGYITFLPGIKAKNGEYVHFVNSYTEFSNGDVVILPGSNAGNTHTVDSSNSKTFKVGQVDYTYDHTTGTITPTHLKDYSVGVMVLEEERYDGTKHAIYVGIGKTGTVTQTVDVALPTFSDTTSTRDGSGGVEYTTWGSNPDIKSAMDAYGTLVTYDSLVQTEAIITYPYHQLHNDIIILVTEVPIETTSTTISTTTTSTISSTTTTPQETTTPTTTLSTTTILKCSDSDLGQNYTTYGVCTDYSNSYKDECEDMYNLKENICVLQDFCTIVLVDCRVVVGEDYVCFKGECLYAPTTTTTTTIPSLGCQGDLSLRTYVTTWWGDGCNPSRTRESNGAVTGDCVDFMVSGMSGPGCESKKVYIREGDCSGTEHCSCTGKTGCSCRIRAPMPVVEYPEYYYGHIRGTYNFFACIDLNGNGVYESNEQDSKILYVDSKYAPLGLLDSIRSFFARLFGFA